MPPRDVAKPLVAGRAVSVGQVPALGRAAFAAAVVELGPHADKCVVFAQMLGGRHDAQVFDAVVEGVFVDVVDDLVGRCAGYDTVFVLPPDAGFDQSIDETRARMQARRSQRMNYAPGVETAASGRAHFGIEGFSGATRTSRREVVGVPVGAFDALDRSPTNVAWFGCEALHAQ